MKIAVLSGKGGTGKTLVSVNLASVARQSVYIDCDVEEPNGHLFFKPKDIKTDNVSVLIPSVDEKACKGCRKCVDFCKFNALAYIKSRLYVFDEICHSCGGCILLCPQNALSETPRKIGEVKKGISDQVTVITGVLNPGEASGVPIIKSLLSSCDADSPDIFIDCPPGSACIVMESIKDADYCVLVAEPTIFGVHNLAMVYELVRLFKKPYGAILNKCFEGFNPAEQFCLDNKISILGKIPFSNELGSANSDAKIVSKEINAYHELFSGLLTAIRQEVQHEATTNT
ncbi:MAG: ATP-binding protein [Eubacteriales bacterium]|nr:ATP-binding protein [Eubacteriales bacterium]MDD3199822.1 ATP-binding protein [Eubacteriales bacterium]MDD4121741.1 ATP-binding protein [Eubacteriales bacterium]MDD4630323.1 ATP-binding protein [Eubacteriales bacterium]